MKISEYFSTTSGLLPYERNLLPINEFSVATTQKQIKKEPPSAATPEGSVVASHPGRID